MAKSSANKKSRKDVVGKRRRAREIAIQMLYQRESGGCSLPEIFAAYDLMDYVHETEEAARNAEEEIEAPPEARLEGARFDPPKLVAPAKSGSAGSGSAGNGSKGAPEGAELRQIESSFSYAQKLLNGVEQNSQEIDERIRRHAENWRLERMPMIDRNILRLAVYEMLYESSVPKVVIVDEAIELAKKFGSENSGRFVNGLLDGVLKAETEERIAGDPVPGSGGPP